MTPLKPIDAALDELLTENAARTPLLWCRPDYIASTGRHPVKDGTPTRPGRHAEPWTPGAVYRDANDGLACYQSTARHADRSFIGGAFGLLAHEVQAAARVITEMEAAGMPATWTDDVEWRTEAAYL